MLNVAAAMARAKMVGPQRWTAGVDEVGRGALFGPVVAAAVVLSPEVAASLAAAGLTDSKRLGPQHRQRLARMICAQADDYSLGWASAGTIDRINILQATFVAMTRAVAGLAVLPQRCLIDGPHRVPHLAVEQQPVVKGDQLHIEIAAASVVAKVWRDTLIERLDRRYPGYGLATNKGYGSRQHRQALTTLGPTRHHRRSFRGCGGAGGDG